MTGGSSLRSTLTDQFPERCRQFNSAGCVWIVTQLTELCGEYTGGTVSFSEVQVATAKLVEEVGKTCLRGQQLDEIAGSVPVALCGRAFPAALNDNP